MIVTRIARSKGLTTTKFMALEQIAGRLGRLRTEVWDRYGSIAGVRTNAREVRDRWLAERRAFEVPARLWKETLSDVFADIEASRSSSAEKARKAIYRHTEDPAERKRLRRALADGTWTGSAYLRRVMRKYWRRGHTSVSNQIVLDSQCYRCFEHGGRGFVEVMSLVPRKRIAIPLDTNHPISGRIRLLLRDGRVEVHHTIDAEVGPSSGSGEIGVDAGFTEVFTDSDGERHGEGLGVLLANESDQLKAIYRRRGKLKAIAKAKLHKREKIVANNLGRKKLNARKRRHRERVRTVVYEAAHAVVNKAGSVAAEDLTTPFRSKDRGANANRRLATWVKGLIALALLSISHRRGASVVLVNAAYTSQACHRCGCLGARSGDAFHCTKPWCGVVCAADVNAALNILARLRDPEIRRWTPYREVRSILRNRERLRLGLLNQDSSCTDDPVSTESELPFPAQL